MIMREWEPEENALRGVKDDLEGGKELERNGKMERKVLSVNQVDCFKLFNWNITADVTNDARNRALQVCVSLFSNHSCRWAGKCELVQMPQTIFLSAFTDEWLLNHVLDYLLMMERIKKRYRISQHKIIGADSLNSCGTSVHRISVRKTTLFTKHQQSRC